MGDFYWEMSYFLSTIIVSVGIYTLGGEFRARYLLTTTADGWAVCGVRCKL